jgi:hypothetical protein
MIFDFSKGDCSLLSDPIQEVLTGLELPLLIFNYLYLMSSVFSQSNHVA